MIESPLLVGFVGKEEQTGHPAQKPIAVYDRLIRMSTAEAVPPTMIKPIDELFKSDRAALWATTYNLELALFNEVLAKVQPGAEPVPLEPIGEVKPKAKAKRK